MPKIKCRVADYVDRFYLPEAPGQFARGGQVIEIEAKEAKPFNGKQLLVLSEKDLKILEDEEVAKTDAELMKRDREIQQLKKELADMKKKKDAEAENIALKVKLAEANSDKESPKGDPKKNK